MQPSDEAVAHIVTFVLKGAQTTSYSPLNTHIRARALRITETVKILVVDLEPCTEYIFSVYSVAENGVSNNPIKVKGKTRKTLVIGSLSLDF
ncbi:unnamed protein product [Protopolystoma xenopodis]|uniref:Uncharacterized protein n=1 Tax=Protopolystoma xenopodis TaxID=117903 RepID=A0A448X2I7_9PLAT|nr:unnamed protein product [Protopolystoma xenopodis]